VRGCIPSKTRSDRTDSCSCHLQSPRRIRPMILTCPWTTLPILNELVKMETSQTVSRNLQAPSDAPKRSAKACNRCRKRRTKCIGEPPYPCKTCRNAGHACVYSETEKRVTVSESYLVELQTQARASINARDDHDRVADVAETSSEDIELGFTSTDNWVLSKSGQYRT